MLGSSAADIKLDNLHPAPGPLAAANYRQHIASK